MPEEYVHPAEREAERLRVIIESLAFAAPSMTIFEAAPKIFEIEQKTMAHEKVQWDKQLAAMRPPPSCTLPDTSPATAAKFVDLCQEIKDFMPHKKINAIKELRARTGLGLKEAKDGIEYWEKFGSGIAPTPPASSSGSLPSSTWSARDVAEWIQHDPAGRATRRILDGKAVSAWKIAGIKQCRADSMLGLKEAKDGCEEWLRIYG